eukprot:TRINITY_DN1806_c0_g1_i1.p1 TRINITY_DN1806_c0_g1~~TRINITY_DN1806_c0_g1_i1.p1  ORF type:complete len:516 (+),score=37.62 TRINITY_DN1806_c0_g1_i1:287-1834(+)
MRINNNCDINFGNSSSCNPDDRALQLDIYLVVNFYLMIILIVVVAGRIIQLYARNGIEAFYRVPVISLILLIFSPFAKFCNYLGTFHGFMNYAPWNVRIVFAIAPHLFLLLSYFPILVFWMSNVYWRVMKIRTAVADKTYVLYCIPGVSLILAVNVSIVVLILGWLDGSRAWFAIDVVLFSQITVQMVVICIYLHIVLKSSVEGDYSSIYTIMHLNTLLLFFRSIINCLSTYGNDSIVVDANWYIVTQSIKSFLYFMNIILIVKITKVGQYNAKGAKLLMPRKVTKINIHGDAITSNVVRWGESGPSISKWSEEQIRLAQEILIWKQWPKGSEWTNFPHPIGSLNIKTKGYFIIMEVCILIVLDYCFDTWYLFIFISLGYASRVIFASRLNWESWITLGIMLPALEKAGFKQHYYPGPPKRFAQFCGCCLSSIAVIVLAFGYKLEAYLLFATLITLLTLDAVFDICMGCVVFMVGMYIGLVPKETCEQCRTMFETNDSTDGSTATATYGVNRSAR